MPYPPSIVSFDSLEFKSIAVTAAAASTGPSAIGYEIFYRLDTTDPDGAWSYRGPEASVGACDSFPVCYIWNTAAFHNYTVRIIPFSGNGFGFGSPPYKVRAREKRRQRLNSFAFYSRLNLWIFNTVTSPLGFYLCTCLSRGMKIQLYAFRNSLQTNEFHITKQFNAFHSIVLFPFLTVIFLVL